MFKTEVVASKNIRKTLFFKIYNAIAILLMIFIVSMSFNLFGSDSIIGQFIKENYNTVVRPAIFAFVVLVFISSIVSKSSLKSPKRLGSLEMNENEIKFLVNDELKETIAVSDLTSIEFEFFSTRMLRGNPAGCMNYLKLNNQKGSKTFEIVVENSLLKAELGDVLRQINQKIPVKVYYTNILKKILKDADFKF